MCLVADDQTHLAAIQRRTLRVLFATQILGGVGVSIGASVGALLAADIAGVGVSGLAPSTAVIGAALFAIPATAIVHHRGRRPSLATAYLVAALGSLIVVFAATRGFVPLMFAGFFLFGGATAAGLQARYAAVDLAPPTLRGRHLSIVVWATTIGAIAGPNLAAVAGAALDNYGIPTLAAPFAFSAVLLTAAALTLTLLMRPDPALVGRTASAASPDAAPAPRVGMRTALRHVAAHAEARLGMAAVAVGHLVMVGVMTMTPVHIRSAGHDAAHTLRIVGLVISVHIVGMYAFSPIVGWLTDRLGRRAVILAGIALLIGACAIAATAGHDHARLGVGLTLLGLGWSFTMVAGSTLLSESVPLDVRASAQGLSDLTMGLAGATAGALSGVVVYAWGFAMLGLVGALATVPFLALAARRQTVDG